MIERNEENNRATADTRRLVTIVTSERSVVFAMFDIMYNSYSVSLENIDLLHKEWVGMQEEE